MMVSNPNDSGYINALRDDANFTQGNVSTICYNAEDTAKFLALDSVKDPKT